MKKILKIAVIVAVVLLVGSNSYARTRRILQRTPPQRLRPRQTFLQRLHRSSPLVPTVTQTTLLTHRTRQISPVSWWLKNHINEGRRELNVSEFGTYADKKKGRKLHEICEQVEKEMPLPSYLWIHRDATLSDNDIKVLCDWAESERAKYPQ